MKTPYQHPQNKLIIKKDLKYKILFVIIPFFLIIFSFLGITIYFSSNNGITNIAKEFMGYKLQEVNSFFQDQLQQKKILEDSAIDVTFNIFQNTVDYTTKFTDENFLIIPYKKSDFSTELYLSKNEEFSQFDLNFLYDTLTEKEQLFEQDPRKRNSWFEFNSEMGIRYVAIYLANYKSQNWLLLTTKYDNFYRPVWTIMTYVVIIFCIGLLIMIALIIFFVGFLTKPLDHFVKTIKEITDTMDFSRRIRIYYPDEIGLLGGYFNQMVQELEKSYNHIKNYAYNTVLAKKKEERIRFIFQKYVPSDVIEEVLEKSTDSMLIGKKQKVTILFSDIRDFTTISESISPEQLVLSLNNYFTLMVNHIVNNYGIIDKFIGDAIMAVFGAPKQRKNDAEAAVITALNMIESLMLFNENQKIQSLTLFEIGIGINTGEAIVGNIGSDQKLDYTVMVDPVNLGSRLEGLTKLYKVPLLISETTKNDILNDNLYFVHIDNVRVKGKTFPIKIYYPVDKIKTSTEELSFYLKFSQTQVHYFAGHFEEALQQFSELEQNKGFTHFLATMYRERSEYLIQNPPSEWDGIQNWTQK
ncbi:MAG: adenylate/guanylate cyclase domain-containing protein [Brevinema sp.]